jgi:hypothetical protein
MAGGGSPFVPSFALVWLGRFCFLVDPPRQRAHSPVGEIAGRGKSRCHLLKARVQGLMAGLVGCNRKPTASATQQNSATIAPGSVLAAYARNVSPRGFY